MSIYFYDQQDNEMIDTNSNMFALVNEALSIDSQCIDHVCPVNDIKFIPESEMMASRDISRSNVPMSGEFTMHSISQFMSKIGVPTSYYKRMRSKNMNGLIAHNVHEWTRATNGEMFVRKYNNQIRGILSTRYSVMDTPKILDAIIPFVREADLNLKSFVINPERFHARFVEPTPMHIPEEDIFFGITVDSSDVGRSALNVQGFAYKQVCTNGMVVAQESTTIFKQRHMGLTPEEMEYGLIAGMEKLETIKENFRDSIIRTQMEVNRLFPVSIEEDNGNAVEDAGKKIGLSAEQSLLTFDLLKKERYDGSNMLGVVHAITDVAKNYTLEERLKLETIAGGLLVA